MSDDLCELTAVELSAKFRALSVTPAEALTVYRARIDRFNPRLNAIVTLDVEGARAAAEQSGERWRSGQPLSPLDGVPITVKDNLLVRGLRATWGSRVYESYVPDHDELPVARLRAAGLVTLGKTNVPEFTLQGYTDNRLFGPTRNPWDLRLTPGGSSGGAVASVASGMVPLAIGTDGGGSIRRPASHTGVVGLKPTTGRVARGRGFPAILHDLEVVGPIARDVADIAALMAIVAGSDQRDWMSLAWRRWSDLDGSGATRILYVPRFARSPVDPEIAASVKNAAGVLSALGCEVDEGEAPFDVEETAHAFGVIGASGLAWLMRHRRAQVSLLTPDMQTMLDNGSKLTAADYADALAVAEHLKRTLAEFFGSFDVLMTPAAAALAWPAEQSHPQTIAGQPVGPRGHAVFTAFANMSGCPGIALPCSFSSAGLPIGFQLVAARGHDELLVALGRSYEAVQPWLKRRPALAAV
jgi:aspartyl-tRNA(Asn)/glutamyl-tRNA(Gln) amidotransferase subunit A